MTTHKKLYTRLFRKTHRRRPNKRLQYLRGRRKTRAKQIRRALRQANVQPPVDPSPRVTAAERQESHRSR